MLDKVTAHVNEWLTGQDWTAWVAQAGLVIVALLLALFVHAIVFMALRKMADRTHNKMADLLVAGARKPARLLVMTYALFLVLPSLALPGSVVESVQRLLTLVLTGGVGWLAIRLVGAVMEAAAAVEGLSSANDPAIRQMVTRLRILRRVAVFAIMLITACLILMSIPAARQVGVSLFASAGLAGLVAGLAARPAISNLIAGIQLALTEPIRLEDAVIVEGEYGNIEEITSTYVVVRTWDLRRLIVPLTSFIERPFQNWTRDRTELLGSVMLYVDYTTPVDALREELARIVKTSPLWNGAVVGLQVTDCRESVIELRALCSARSASEAWDLRCYVREQLIAYLQSAHPHALPRARSDVSFGNGAQPSAMHGDGRADPVASIPAPLS